MSGKHYSRCWLVHENFSEGLERLFIKKFLPENSDTIQKLGLVEHHVDIEQFLNDAGVIICITKNQEVKRKGLNEEFGSTTWFWFKYVEIVETAAISFCPQRNQSVQSWEKILSLYFITNKVHYARYGTYHIEQLKEL